MHFIKTYRIELSMAFACCVGVFCMWQITLIMMTAYWGALSGAQAPLFEWFEHLRWMICVLAMGFFGFYLPARWDRQEWAEHANKDASGKHAPTALTQTDISSNPWNRFGNGTTAANDSE